VDQDDALGALMVVVNHVVRFRSMALAAILVIGSLVAAAAPAGAADIWLHEAEMEAPAPADGDLFGYAVAIQGDTVVVGEPRHDGSADNRGVAHVYTRNPSTGGWAGQELVPPVRTNSDGFGASVAIDGDRIAVGAPGSMALPVSSSGSAVHVFELAGGSWDHAESLIPAGLPSGARLGESVAIDGDTVVAGAPREHVGEAFYAGAVYVFTPGASTGWEHQRLTAPTAAATEGFGTAVAVDGHRMAIGAPRADSANGAVYAFVRGATGNWASQYRMTHPAGESDVELGTSVDVSGDLIVAGAPGKVDDAAKPVVRVFRKVTGPIVTRAWEQVAAIRSPSDEALDPTDLFGDYFGGSVSLDGTRLVVGAEGDDGDGTSRGAVHVFEGEAGGAAWSAVQTLRHPDPVDYQYFGSSLAVDGGSIIGGASAWIYNGPGEAHVFARDAVPPTVSLAFPSNGARLAQGVPAAADFACSDGGSGVSSCVGSVADGSSSVPIADGQPIDTSALGSFEFSVKATDYAGNSTTVTHTYEVVEACDGVAVTLVVPPGGKEFPGTPGDDVILGSEGPDVIKGLGGDDTVCGLGGDDLILGGPGDDTLIGGDGNDKLRGAAGDDVLWGGAGSDRLLPETGMDVLDGGGGSDIVDYLAADGPVTVDLAAGTAVYEPVGGGVWSATLVGVEKVDGSIYADRLVGNAKRNVLRGKQGDDEISGGGGDDDLIGGTGDDTVRGGDGDDLVKGQANGDALYGDAGADKVVGGSGSDTLRGGDGNDTLVGGLRSHLGVFVNILDGGTGTDACRWDTPTTDCEP
jgi:Ca2+-binding RTX toxin-like protein